MIRTASRAADTASPADADVDSVDCVDPFFSTAASSADADVDSVDCIDSFFSARRRRQIRNHDLPALLDLEAWEVPFRLSEDGLYAEAGADRRGGGHPAEDRDDER